MDNNIDNYLLNDIEEGDVNSDSSSSSSDND